MPQATPLILVLCTGNMCRSPMAEVLMREQLRQRKVAAKVISRGTAAPTGRAPHPFALRTAAHYGLAIASGKRAARAVSSELSLATLILVMDKINYHWVHRGFPQFSGKTFLLGHWQAELEIPDPLSSPEAVFRAQWITMRAACQSWVEHLLRAEIVTSYAPNETSDPGSPAPESKR